MAGCLDCYFGGKKVGYKGNEESPFVIVGESPGPQELYRGEPFVGPPGDLLHSVLNDILADTDIDPFFSNALNCLPRNKDANRLAAACKRCSTRLIDEVKQHPRKIILTLGNAALWSLTGNYDYKITKVRGQVFESYLAELGIVATVHPSFLLRGGGNLHQFKRDIKHAVDLYLGRDDTTEDKTTTESREIRSVGKFTPGTYDILETPAEVARLARQLEDVEYAACDFETDGFNPRRIEVNKPEFFGEYILSAGICFERGHSFVIPGELLTDDLFKNDTKWCWHNGKYDIGWGRVHGLPSVRVDDDTMLLSYLLNEIGGIHDLEQVGADWLQAPDYKDMLEKYLPSRKHSYAVIPKDVLYKYQAIDTELTFWLRDALRNAVQKDAKLWKVYQEILIPATEFLHRVERNGFFVDLERVCENEKEFGGEADQHEKAFNDIIEPSYGSRINIRSWQQLKPVLYQHLKLGPMSWGTDKDTLEKLPAHPAVDELKAYRKVHKAYSTYVKPVKAKMDADGRMHTTFKLHGTTTGRLSSNKPNMQNIPRDARLRGQFIAPPGRCLLEVDLSQAELRMLAQLSGDKEMLSIFGEGRSIHGEVATKIFGDGWGKEQKMIAKNVNFGIVYGISPHGLQEQININAHRQGSTMVVSIRDAAKWLKDWGEQFPQAQAFIDKCRDAPVKGQTLVSAFGRKRRFNVVTFDRLRNMQNEAANFPHQSGAHDITLLAGIHLEEEMKTKYDALAVNEVHDCIVWDLPDRLDHILPVAQATIRKMMQIPRDWGLTALPFEAEAELGYRWGSLVEFDPFSERFRADEKFSATSTAADIVNIQSIF